MWLREKKIGILGSNFQRAFSTLTFWAFSSRSRERQSLSPRRYPRPFSPFVPWTKLLVSFSEQIFVKRKKAKTVSPFSQRVNKITELTWASWPLAPWAVSAPWVPWPSWTWPSSSCRRPWAPRSARPRSAHPGEACLVGAAQEVHAEKREREGYHLVSMISRKLEMYVLK